MNRPLFVALLSFLLTSACGGQQLSGAPDEEVADEELDLKNQSDHSGRWEGTADVTGVKFLRTGKYLMVMHLVQSGTRVRGVIDVKSNSAPNAEWLGYYLDGVVAADNRLHVELTDRACGAGEPEGLCYPNWASKAKVFSAIFKLSATRVQLTDIRVIDGVSYPADRPIELPFSAARASKVSGSDSKISDVLAGKWAGRFNPPESVVFAGQLFFGTNTLTFAKVKGALALTRFDHGKTNIYPAQKDLILAETFHYDPATRRFWFLETGTVYGVWLWMGELRGDTIVGHFVGDAPSGGLYDPARAPRDPFDANFNDFEATFVLKRQ